MKAPSPVMMSKAGAHFGGEGPPGEAHDLSQLLPPRPPPVPPPADEDAAAAGLMTRVTSLFNRALCKPTPREPPAAFLDDRHPSLYARKQFV